MPKNFRKSKIWDVIVIGGGPAGMMAAGTAAERGLSVLMMEKNSDLGKKLLITGGGRCNITNLKENKQLVASYKGNPKALYSIFSRLSVQDTLTFFHDRGLDTKVEALDRVFPVTDRAESVWQVMVSYMNQTGVKIRTNSAVTKIARSRDGHLFKIHTKNGIEVSKACVLATGGKSHPETGSTGDGFRWLQNLGHTVINSNFALVPIALKDTWVKKLSGVSLSNVKISIWQDDKKQHTDVGRLLFTHVGISGPTILNMSSKIGDLLQYGEVTLKVDLLPELDHGGVNNALQSLFANNAKKKTKNILPEIIPQSIVSILMQLANVDPDRFCHSITKQERIALVNVITALPLHVKSLLGEDKAIVSSGGVKIDEVDFQTMESKVIPKLYIVGDVLNIDRPSGGYSLQICWSSGWVAGSSC